MNSVDLIVLESHFKPFKFLDVPNSVNLIPYLDSFGK